MSGAIVPTTTAAGSRGVRRKGSAAAMWLGVNGIRSGYGYAPVPSLSRTARVAASMFSSDWTASS
jgi:hypothetical protein